MKKTILALFAMGMCFAAQAQTLPFDAAVRTGRLANGFSYYIRHNEEPKKRVVFYLANKVGSVQEDEDQRGLAHFMEHMSFNGTKHFPKNDLVSYLQKSGVRFGADLNAYTSFDETVYQLPLPGDSPAVVEYGLQIMRDWAQDATLEPVEIDRERGVVLEEKRLGKGARERMQRQYWPLMLNNSRYAERMPIGVDTVLNNFKPETIRRFYHDWYRPDLQALIVVGDIDVNKIEQEIKTKFGDLKNPGKERARIKYTVPLTGKNRFIAVTDKEMTSTVMEIQIRHPGKSLKTVADYRIHLSEALLNQLLAGRFAELTRSSDPPFIRGNAAAGSFIGGLDVFDISVIARPGQLEKGFKAVWQECERAKRFGFTETELERVKSDYLNQFESALKEKDKTSSLSFVNEYLQYFLKGIAAPGLTYEYGLVKSELNGITLAAINGLLRKEMKTTDRDILLMAPEKDKSSLLDEKLVLEWMKTVEAGPMMAYRDDVSKESLLSIPPKAGKIIDENHDKTSGLIFFSLSNGIKVLLKPTAFKNDQLLFSAFAPGGTSLYSDADYQSATAANIIPSFGAGNYNATQLQKYLSGKQLSVQLSIAERSQNITGGVVNKDLETALQLLYAYFTSPRNDTSLFRGVITRTRANLANRQNDPNSVFSDTVSAVLGNHNIRKTGPTLDKIGQIDVDRAFSIFKERFADASGFTFVFVGSIDTIGIKPLLEKYIASLPALNKGEQARDLHIHIPEGVIERKVYMGSEPKATVNLIFSGLFDYSFENKLKMDALKETLEIRLLERLREDESGVYTPSTSLSVGKLPESRFSFSVSFGCAPQNADKLIASALDEINKIKTNGPPQFNLNKFRAEYQRSMETQIKSNSFWLGYLSSQLQNKEKLDEINNYNQYINAITPADLKALAVKYLNGANYIRLELLPEINK